MKAIYINNYRGFSRTVIPIRPVNFFVGENSTGKTSVLALLELLAGSDFYFLTDFNSGSYEFGGYKDIVSVISDDKKEFQIGFYECFDDEKKYYIYYLFHFREAKDGLPWLVRYSQMSPDLSYCMSIRTTKKQISAIWMKDIPSEISSFDPSICFGFLQDEIAKTTKGYKVLSSSESRARSIPLIHFPILFQHFFEDIESEILKVINRYDIQSRPFASMAPIRTKPKLTYDGYTKRFSPEGEHTPYVIRKQLSRSTKSSITFKEMLNEFGINSGLFQSVGVTQFGKGTASPFELTVTLSSKPLSINSVGYGVSQVLPVVVELFNRANDAWIAVQQPEVHLHPKAQAAIGDVLFESSIRKSQTLFVETHSDYLLDRFRLNMRDNYTPENFAQVVYFERKSDGNHAHAMIIEPSGEYPIDQPAGFRDFFLAEQMRLLEA